MIYAFNQKRNTHHDQEDDEEQTDKAGVENGKQLRKRTKDNCRERTK